MKVKVTRVTTKKWEECYQKLGSEAVLVEVPGILPNGEITNALRFKGVYKDHLKQEIFVKWPIDRPPEAQQAFANQYTFGSFPATEYERQIKPSALSLVERHDA